MNKSYTHTGKEEYLAINNDFQIISLVNFQDAKNNKDCIGVVKLQRKLTYLKEDNMQRLYEWAGNIEFLNVDGSHLEKLKLNGWELSIAELCLNEKSESKYKQCFKSKFIDLLDLEYITEAYDISIDGVKEVMERFARLTKFKEFRIASLQIQKEDLEIENESLKKELSDLYSKISKVKDILG